MEPSDSQFRYSVSVSFSYRLSFTTDVFESSNSMLIQLMRSEQETRNAPRVMIFVDEGLTLAQPDLVRRIERYFALHDGLVKLTCPPKLVLGGEQGKGSKETFEQVVEAIHDARICRHSYVIVLGGGAAIDLVCFAASIVHRGVRQIRIPTTVLAQCDAGIGVKNGIDAFHKKNFLGSFYPPYAVVNDSHFLKTLENSDWLSGVAEAVKVALIKDPEFFYWIKGNASLLKARDLGIMKKLIQRCAELHLRHITTSGDPFEQGSARPLDFGHWAAHKLEQLSHYQIRHGHAVATGMAVDLLYSQRMGWIAAASVREVLGCLADLGFQVWQPLLLEKNPMTSQYSILEGIEEFREHLGGELNITLIREIGEPFQANDLDELQIIHAIKDLKDYK